MLCEQPRCYGQLDGSVRWWHKDGLNSRSSISIDYDDCELRNEWTPSPSDVEEDWSDRDEAEIGAWSLRRDRDIDGDIELREGAGNEIAGDRSGQ